MSCAQEGSLARFRRRPPLRRLASAVLAFFAIVASWALGAVALWPARAAAQLVDEARNDDPPVAAIIPFGARDPKVAEQLAAACEAALARISGLKVLPPARWRKEADESGEGADLEAMAKRLGADVLVTGALGGTAGAPKLAIDILSEKGLPLGSFVIPLGGPPIALGPAADFLLGDGLERVIRPAVGLPRPSPYPQIPPQPEPTPQLEDRERPIEELLRRQREAAPKPLPPRAPWQAVIEGELDGLVVARMLSCGPASEGRRNLQCQQAIYPFSAGGGGRLALTFFPLALKRSLPAALTGLGLRGVVELPSWEERLTTAGTTLPVRQVRAETGLWWRLAFGGGRARPALELALLYGYHRFTLTGGDRDPPFKDAVYQSLIPTLGAGAFLGDRAYVRGQIAYLAVLSAGPSLDLAGQNPFGSGSALGLRGAALLDVRVYRKLLLSLGAQVEQVRMSLDGNGCTKPDPNLKECASAAAMIPTITEAADLHLSAWLGLGFRL